MNTAEPDNRHLGKISVQMGNTICLHRDGQPILCYEADGLVDLMLEGKKLRCEVEAVSTDGFDMLLEIPSPPQANQDVSMRRQELWCSTGRLQQWNNLRLPKEIQRLRRRAFLIRCGVAVSLGTVIGQGKFFYDLVNDKIDPLERSPLYEPVRYTAIGGAIGAGVAAVTSVVFRLLNARERRKVRKLPVDNQ